MQLDLKKLGQSRTQVTVIFPDEAVRSAEEQVIRVLGKSVSIRGFRPGTAPLDLLRGELPPERIQEETIHKLLPGALQSIADQHSTLKPIIRPHVSLESTAPLTLCITFVEQPPVTMKDPDGLRVPKEEKKKEDNKEKKEHADGTPQDEESEKKRAESERERKLFDLIAERTKVDLAPELIADEVRTMVDQHVERLRAFGMEFDDWLAKEGKTPEAFLGDIRPASEKRLKIRLGLSHLIDFWKLVVTDEEMEKFVTSFLGQLPEEYRTSMQPLYAKGTKQYEQFRSQKLIDKVIEKVFAKN